MLNDLFANVIGIVANVVESAVSSALYVVESAGDNAVIIHVNSRKETLANIDRVTDGRVTVGNQGIALMQLLAVRAGTEIRGERGRYVKSHNGQWVKIS